MKKIIALGGAPASGKTTLMRSVLKELDFDKWQKIQVGLVKGHIDPQKKFIVMGLYDDGVFAGTDRLSMGVMPSAMSFLDWVNQHPLMWEATILFEGDRLFTEKFIERCKLIAPTEIFFLDCANNEKARRHIQRKDTQSETWLRGRETKVENLRKRYPEAVILKSLEPDDIEKNMRTLVKTLSCDATTDS